MTTNNNNNDIKKLLEAFDRTEQWRGEDPNPPNGKLVGETEKFLGEPYIREEETDEAFDLKGLMAASDAAKKHAGQAMIPKGSSGDVMHRRENEKLLAHYIRKAHSNGLKGAEAVRWAHRAMHSETQRVFDDKEPVTERELGAGAGDATQRGTPPWMMPGGGSGDGNGGKKTSFKLASDDEEESDVNPFMDIDEEETDEAVNQNAFDYDMATPATQMQPQTQQPKSYGDVRGNLSPAARNMFAQRELAKMSKQDYENNPFEGIDSSKYDTAEALAEALTKAYEDYVGDPYAENNVIPKANAKKPGKDVPKAKKAKREPEPNELNEIWADQVATRQSDAEDRAWERNFKKAQAAKKKAQAAKAKKEKPFKDAAATGNPRDFANEADANEGVVDTIKKGVKKGIKSLKRAKDGWAISDFADIDGKDPGPKGIKKRNQNYNDKTTNMLHKRMAGVDSTKHSPGGLQKRVLDREVAKRKNRTGSQVPGSNGPLDEAGKKSENRELWDRIKARGTVPSIDRERYTDMSGEGLEGPFRQKNGQVLYYDPKAGQYYNRDSDMYVDDADYKAMNEGDPDIPHDIHMRNKEKDRQAFAANFRRGEGDRMRKVSNDAVERFMQQAKNFTKPEQATVGESGRGAKLAALRAKFEDVSCKLKELKGQKALKEAPIDQVVAQPGQQQQQQQVPGQPQVATTKPQPINTAQSPAQQAPVQAPAGTPTAVPAPGQPVPPTAGQPGGAPVQAPGTPAPPGQGATNAATTPGEQMKGFVQSLSSNPAGAKQLATKLNTVR